MRHGGTLVGFVVVGMLVALTGQALAADRPNEAFPNPARQPSFHRTQSSAFDLGSIEIPSIGVDETIRSGVSLSVIDRGVAQWAGTVGPGEDGNLVLAGHRTTHSRHIPDPLQTSIVSESMISSTSQMDTDSVLCTRLPKPRLWIPRTFGSPMTWAGRC